MKQLSHHYRHKINNLFNEIRSTRLFEYVETFVQSTKDRCEIIDHCCLHSESLGKELITMFILICPTSVFDTFDPKVAAAFRSLVDPQDLPASLKSEVNTLSTQLKLICCSENEPCLTHAQSKKPISLLSTS